MAEISADKNLFEELVPEAKSVLRRIMHNTRDDKIAGITAKEILVMAGVKPKESAPTVPVLIKDSHVQLLVQVASEIKGARKEIIDEDKKES